MGLFSRPSPKLETLEADIEGQSRRVKELLRALDDLETEVKRRFTDLEENVDLQAKTVRLMSEELEERIDRGNKIWRKIRAAEYYERERADSEDDEDASYDLFSGNGEGRAPEELPPMHRNVGDPRSASSTARQVGQAIARRIAGI